MIIARVLTALLLTAAAATASPISARADDKVCTVGNIAERAGPGAHLTVYCADNSFAARIPTSDPARAARWLSMMLAAMLSGKTVYMDVGDCTGLARVTSPACSCDSSAHRQGLRHIAHSKRLTHMRY